MATPPLSDAVLQSAMDAYGRCGTKRWAARELGIPLPTLKCRLESARQRGLTPASGLLDPENPAHLTQKINYLKDELKHLQDQALTHNRIRQTIFNLAETAKSYSPPSWLLHTKQGHAAPGVPSLFLSDLHWGEVIQASQINGANTYNLTIARARLKYLAEGAIRLLNILSPKMEYPGIVVVAGGDFISGNIHDELTATNELNTMPTLLDLFDHGARFFNTLLDAFPKVHVPLVTGNHGRDTMKIWHKDRHHTSFDWLLGCLWAKHFAGNPRITFQIPDGSDAYFKIFQHRYLLTHGDQFRGGDGMIGALGPIIRGDHKKRSRNAQIDMEYDTLLLGHWHQYIHLTRLIVNGSLKGYDEYAYANNFPFEKPQQALWLTHPKYGITYRMPVFVNREQSVQPTRWISAT